MLKVNRKEAFKKHSEMKKHSYILQYIWNKLIILTNPVPWWIKLTWLISSEFFYELFHSKESNWDKSEKFINLKCFDSCRSLMWKKRGAKHHVTQHYLKKYDHVTVNTQPNRKYCTNEISHTLTKRATKKSLLH